MKKWEKTACLGLALALAASLLPVQVLASEGTEEEPSETMSAASGNWAIDEQNFPDENFRAYVLENWDEDGDETLSKKEVGKAEKMDVSGLGIASLEGVACFQKLKKLDCSGNLLTELDLTGMERLQQLRCQDNRLAELNVSGCRELEALYCSKNQLTTLNLDDHSELTTLLCRDNRLEGLNLAGCPKLEFLLCAGNALAFLDVGANEALTEVQAQGNVSFRPELMDSRSFDLNTIPGFDPSRAKAWENAVVAGGVLTVDEFASSLSFDYDVTGTGETETFVWQIPKPQGVPLNEENFPDDHFRLVLSVLLDTEKDRVLTPDEIAAGETLDLTGWNVSSLQGIGHLSALKSLICSGNRLPFLDVSGCPQLTGLEAEGNEACLEAGFDRTLDVTTIPGFDPQRASSWTGGTLVGNILEIHEDRVTFTYDVDGSLGEKTAEFALTFRSPQGLKVDEAFPDESFRGYILENVDQNGDGMLDDRELAAVTRLDLEGMHISSLEGVEQFPSLQVLQCGYNNLQSLDLRDCAGLVKVNCDGNGLKSLLLPAGENLEVVSCEYNRLDVLDVRGCGGLRWLFCGDNRLKELDVSANENLEKLACAGNGFDRLDLSNAPRLNQLIWEGVPQMEKDAGELKEEPAYEPGNDDDNEHDDDGEEDGEKARPCASHVFAQWQSMVLPTCTAEGALGHSRCTVCGKIFDLNGRELTELTIPAAPGRHGSVVPVPECKPTCTEGGFTAGTYCQDCGQYVTGHTPIPAAHQLGRWSRAVPATADAPGTLGHFTCQVCGMYFDAAGREIIDLATTP